MFDFKEINKTYTYDGTFEGLLTIVFNCYVENIIPFNIINQNNYTPSIFETYEHIETDLEKSSRILNGISKSISKECLYKNYTAFLSVANNKETNILKYLLYGFKIGPEIDNMLSIDSVLIIEKIRKTIWFEAQRLKGFVRFTKIADELYYSVIEPDNNILEILGEHFIRRFPNQNFVLHDKKRNIAFLYDTKKFSIVNADYINIPNISLEEQHYKDLWKAFVKAVAITERKNSRLQKQFMPKRYWKNMFETEH